MRALITSTAVLATVVLLVPAGCSNPLDLDSTEQFGCDKSAEAVDPHCTDFTFKGNGTVTNPDQSKKACQDQGGKVVATCQHGLGGCKGVETTLTAQTTWYFPDDTTKTVDDVKKKCADTGGSFVDP